MLLLSYLYPSQHSEVDMILISINKDTYIDQKNLSSKQMKVMCDKENVIFLLRHKKIILLHKLEYNFEYTFRIS